ncbi:hypothetical protein RND71_018506 [Anisodus tanguticus]|uniref:DNA-directed DNA polymerase n=1 Tax=Anisodus tanguticus TaxID=243964 RepID=A0AAE1VKA4_9SOLA|nr:hypothetical protein RND71_018506 [Anisodus tanguticus]
METYFSKDYITINSFDERSSKVVEDFLSSIEHIAKGFRPALTIYFHNLGRFDGVFLLKNLTSNWKGEVRPIMRNNRIYQISVKSGKRVLFHFRDSLNMLKGMLDSLSKTLCPELGHKGFVDHKKVTLQNLESTRGELLDYLRKDVLLLGAPKAYAYILEGGGDSVLRFKGPAKIHTIQEWFESQYVDPSRKQNVNVDSNFSINWRSFTVQKKTTTYKLEVNPEARRDLIYDDEGSWEDDDEKNKRLREESTAEEKRSQEESTAEEKDSISTAGWKAATKRLIEERAACFVKKKSEPLIPEEKEKPPDSIKKDID